MRTLFILRGCPASGKSTWIKENNLEDYTISADGVRHLFQSPELDLNGNYITSSKNDGIVWNNIMKILETRMERGDFICIDATHYKSELLNKYKKLISKYRYRAFVVDFTDIPLNVLLERNSRRSSVDFVPEDSIRKMNALFENDYEVNSKFTVITRQQAIDMLHSNLLFDYNTFNKLVVIGDIHGCYSPLKEWFEQHPMSEDTGYIFVGDYLDRGIENGQVLEFLISLVNKKNVLFLEGNHERWLRLYANDEGAELPIDGRDKQYWKKVNPDYLKSVMSKKIKYKTFIENTIPQIAHINKKDIRVFCHKLAQMAYVSFANKNIFVCHGGIPTKPSVFVSTNQIINGVGKYADTDSLYNAWNNDDIMVHGHRNQLQHPLKVNDNIYNLCDEVEFGKFLRIVEFSKDDNGNLIDKEYLIKNNVFNPELKISSDNKTIDLKDLGKNTENILEKLSSSHLVWKNTYGHITSYNFTRNAFNNRKWNDITCTARGLFVENSTNKIIARSYNKFFNWKEVSITEPDYLKENLHFPLQCFKKENGFLALVGYDFIEDTLLITTKGSVVGEFVDYIREVFDLLPENIQIGIKNFLKENNCTMVFECVNSKDNTHPIWYEKNHLYLLDIVYNDFEYHKMPFEKVVEIANNFNLEHKELLATFDNWDEFVAFKDEHGSLSKEPYKPTYEGFVFEDATGFMFKYKVPFYKYWKHIRTMMDKLSRGRQIKKNFSNERDARIYGILQKILHEEGQEALQKYTVVDIEKIYYSQFEYNLLPVDK